jgi:hypothetical protein
MSRNKRASVFAIAAPVLLMLSASCLLSSRSTPTKQALIWHTDLAQARAEARQAGMPLFVVFRCER